jgi:dGTPase
MFKVFAHNVQSVRTLVRLEDNGKGKNISVQVLDAILCHNGEILECEYHPIKKDKETFLKEYDECSKDISLSKKLDL